MTQRATVLLNILGHICTSNSVVNFWKGGVKGYLILMFLIAVGLVGWLTDSDSFACTPATRSAFPHSLRVLPFVCLGNFWLPGAVKGHSPNWMSRFQSCRSWVVAWPAYECVEHLSWGPKIEIFTCLRGWVWRTLGRPLAKWLWFHNPAMEVVALVLHRRVVRLVWNDDTLGR